MDEQQLRSLNQAKAILQGLQQKNKARTKTTTKTKTGGKSSSSSSSTSTTSSSSSTSSSVATRKEILGEYTEVLNHLVDAIAKMANEEEIMAAEEERSESCSITLPETVVTTDSSSYYCVNGAGAGNAGAGNFMILDGCESASGGHGGMQSDYVHHHTNGRQQQRATSSAIEQYEQYTTYWRSDQAEPNDYCDSDDDDISESSDVIPLTMADEDALDEISLTRELMGYMEGFEGETLQNYCGPIMEERNDENNHNNNIITTTTTYQSDEKKKKKSPLHLFPRQTLKKPTLARSKTEETKQTKPHKATHRRQLSGGSAPTILEAVAEIVPTQDNQQIASQQRPQRPQHRRNRSVGLTSAALRVHNNGSDTRDNRLLSKNRIPLVARSVASSTNTPCFDEDPGAYDQCDLTLCELCSMPLPDGAACDCGTFEI